MMTEDPSQYPLVASARSEAVDALVTAWLRDAGERSSGKRTQRAYADTLASFRAVLWRAGLDLGSDRQEIRRQLREWAASPRPDGRAVSANTHNHRLSVVSAFYSFALADTDLEGVNPARRIKRWPVQEYAAAQPLDAGTVTERMRAIDRATLRGARDYALLSVAFATGRRLSELRDMSLGHIEARLHDGVRVALITFPRAKGGKVMYNELPASVSAALYAWLAVAYPDTAGDVDAQWPVWYSLSQRSAGRRLSARAVGGICAHRLGVSKVHTTRHTFAAQMEAAGAPVSEIQAQLGHASIATTGRYLARLRSSHNQWGDALASAFGLGD